MAEDKVRVQTSDKHILEVDLDVAKQWGPIKTMYEVFGTVDTKDKPVELENVDAETLQKIIEWATQHKQDVVNQETNENQQRRQITIPAWDKDFLQVKQEMLFALIMAANYLGMTVLLDMACKTVADMIKDKTPEEVRQTFNIPNDLPPLEQAQ